MTQQTDQWVLTEEGRQQVWSAGNLIIEHVEHLRNIAQNPGTDVKGNWHLIDNDIQLAHQALEELKAILCSKVVNVPF